MSTPGGGRRSFLFGAFTLDIERGALLKEGTDVRLRPKSFEVLRYLLERHGRLVSKDELLSAVWGRTAVTEGALTQCVVDIRRALGDQAQQRIRTVPRRGYRFDGPVIEQGNGAAPAPRWPRTRVAAMSAVGLLLAVIAGWLIAIQRTDLPATAEPEVASSPPISIAVLPFVDLSAEQDQAHLADGLAEEILNRLAQAPELRVIARTSAFSFRGQDADIATIARRLSVTHVLEGSVRRAGQRVRVTAQLVEVAGSSHLWSETYDRNFDDDVFRVLDEIAGSVAEALHVRLVGSHAGAAAPNAQAHERFLQGQFFYYRRASGDLERALDYYRQAVALDPHHARAWAGLAAAYGLLTDEGKVPAEVGLAQQLQAAEQAVALNPQLAEAYLRLSQYYFAVDDVKRGREHFNRGVTLDPNNPLALSFSANVALNQGRLDEAIELDRRALSLDPLAAVRRANLAHLLLAAGRLEEAMTELLQVQALNPALVDPELTFILILQQRCGEALERIEQWPQNETRDLALVLVHHALGRRDEADAALERLRARSSDISSGIRLAEAYAYRGQADAAFRALERVLEQHDRDRTSSAWPAWLLQTELRVSPFLASLRDDPRWQGVLAELENP